MDTLVGEGVMAITREVHEGQEVIAHLGAVWVCLAVSSIFDISAVQCLCELTGESRTRCILIWNHLLDQIESQKWKCQKTGGS